MNQRLLESCLATAAIVLLINQSVYGQTPQATIPQNDLPVIVSSSARNLALEKMLEGQRYMISSYRLRSQAGVVSTMRLARESFLKAVELDPGLAEAYTALAEIAITVPPNDIEEGIRFASAAIKINKDNFGGHKILARLNTLKSGLNAAKLIPGHTEAAIGEWKEVVRLDPRNSEGWAFLAAFYERTAKRDEQIEAMRRWGSSAQPIETEFYQLVRGRTESLAPESAAVKLGGVLLRAGKYDEAAGILGTAIADEPDNVEAVELLREALLNANAATLSTAVSALQQAAYADPSNFALLSLLVEQYESAGRIKDAEVLLSRSADELGKKDKRSSAAVLLSLGELYYRSQQYGRAIAEFEKALVAIGFGGREEIDGSDREFAKRVLSSIIRSHQALDRPNDVATVVRRARLAFGAKDLFPDKQMIMYLRSTGKRDEALKYIRTVRAATPADESLQRLEAIVLAELGKVDDAVFVMRTKGRTAAVTQESQVVPTVFDEFSNLLFISKLYADADRGIDAVTTANTAISIASGDERLQIAKLSLATALQVSGDFALAESTLRELIRISPGNPIALNNLGFFLVERNERLDEAESLIKRALEVDPTNPSYLDSLGWSYFRLGKYMDAERILRMAARYDDASMTICDHLGDVLDRQGKHLEANKAWRRAAELAERPDDISRIRKKIK